MVSDSQEYQEEFPTEQEAEAFIQGIEFFDDEHTSTEPPTEELNGDNRLVWIVTVRRFA